MNDCILQSRMNVWETFKEENREADGKPDLNIICGDCDVKFYMNE